MAGPVKGTIGNDEVTLNDAATETTLLKMLAAIKKQGGGGGGGASAGKTSEKQLMDMAKAAGKTTDELEDLEEQVEETSNMLARGFGQLSQMVQGLAHEFLGGSTSISDFASHITGALSAIPIVGPLVGGALQLLISVVDQNIQTFREMSQVGVDFGASIMGAKLAATQAGLSLETFQNVITSNSESLALFAGGASEGAKRFAQISGQIQKQFGPQFSKLGLTMEETAEYTADYLEMQTSLGRAQKMSNRELTSGIANTVLEVDKLARVTGKRRDQIMEELKENMADKRLKLIFNTMDEAAQQNLNGVLTMMGSASPDLKDAITEMVATGGVPLNEMGQDLVRLNPNLAAMSKGLKDGSVSQEQFMAEIRRTAEMADNLTDAQKEQYSTLAAMGSSVGSAIIEIIGLKNAGKKLTDAQKEQLKAFESREKATADFERVLQETKNKIYDALIKSGIFTDISELMGSFTTWLASPNGTARIEEFTNSISTKFKELLEAFKSGNLMQYVKDMLATGLSGLGGMIGKLIGGIFGGGDKKEELDEDGNPVEKKGSGLFVGLDGALSKLAGMVAVGGAVYLAIKGFQVLLGGFANPTVIAGAAVLTGLLIGTGAAIKLAGDGIKSAGEGVESIAAGVERMAAVKDTAKLTDIATALGSLGSAMLKFAGADLISGIGSLFGGDNVFDTMVEGIGKFAKIDAVAITNVAALSKTGLSDLGDAMIKLSAGGIIDSIGSFFGAKSPFEKMVTGINEFSKIDANAVANLTGSASGLANLKSFTDDLDADGVKDYAKSLKELAEAMRKLNVVLADSNSGRKESGYGVSDLLKSEGGLGGSGISNSTLEQLMRTNNTLLGKILEKNPENAY
jgi:hypothetical protein